MLIDHTGRILPRRSEAAYMAQHDEDIPYTPTPEERDKTLAEIQAGWSKSEEKRRRVQQGKPWTPPHGTAHISEPGE